MESKRAWRKVRATCLRISGVEKPGIVCCLTMFAGGWVYALYSGMKELCGVCVGRGG